MALFKSEEGQAQGQIVSQKQKKKVKPKPKKRKRTMIVDEEQRIEPTVTPEELDRVRNAVETEEPELIIQGLLDDSKRKELWNHIAKNHGVVTKEKKENVDYLVREIVGTGVIEEIIRDKKVTDVHYNGRDVIIESNDKKIRYHSKEPLDKNYIERVIQKFANANGKEFTERSPLFDGSFENIRVSATHSSNTSHGQPTMSLRMVYPRLALQEKNFEGFAPMAVYELFRILVGMKKNIVISGETGTGKTELQKLLISFIPFEDKIILIEDVAETFAFDMFPEKDIYPWLTSGDVGITQLVKKAMRDNPTWLMVTETRGGEAYEMIQAALSGHSITTSLHTINARAIPSRLVGMSKAGGYEFSEENLTEDILRYFDFGVHIKRAYYGHKVYRYLSEIVAFDPVESKTIFEQKFIGGEYRAKFYDLPEGLQNQIDDKLLSLKKEQEQFGENHLSEGDKQNLGFKWETGEFWRKSDENGYIIPVPVVDVEGKEESWVG